MKKTREEAEITKESLISSAIEVLSNTSYKAARLEDIARAAGVTRGAIYWHFENKPNLYKEIINASFEESMKDLFTILNSTIPTPDKITGIMNYLLGEKIKTHQKSAQIYNLLFVEKPSDLTDSLTRVEGWFSTLFDKHREVLEQGITAGSIHPSLDTDFEPRAFYNFLWGYFTNSERFFGGYNNESIKNYIKKTFIDSITI